MGVEDILDRSIAMLQMSAPITTYASGTWLSTTSFNSLWPSAGNSLYFVVPFSFDETVIGAGSDKAVFSVIVNFSGDVSGGGNTHQELRTYIFQNGSQSAPGQVTIELKSYLGGQFLDSTGNYNIDVRKTYHLVFRMLNNTTYLLSYVMLRESDEDYGVSPTEVFNYCCSVGLTGAFGSIDNITVNPYRGPNKLSYKVYEPCVSDYRVIAPLNPLFTHRLYNMNERIIDCTYSVPTYGKTWILPPQPALDGSAYDLSAYLQDELDDVYVELEDSRDEIDDLQLKLTTARANALDNIDNSNLLDLPDLSDIFSTNYLGKIKDNIPDLTDIFSSDYLGKIKDNIPDLTNIFSSDYLGKIKDNIPDLTNIFSTDYLGKIKDTLPDLSVVFDGATLKDAVVEALFGQIINLINEVSITREAS